MRRRLTILCLLAALSVALAIPGTTAAAAGLGSCRVRVTPAVGGPDGVFRIKSRGWEAGTFEDPTHVMLTIKVPGRATPHEIYLVHLMPGFTAFYLDFHADDGSGEPILPLRPGRYRVIAEADDHSCVARASFRVRS